MSLWNILREHSQSLLVIMGVCGSIFAMGAVYETLKFETKMKETEVFHQYPRNPTIRNTLYKIMKT